MNSSNDTPVAPDGNVKNVMSLFRCPLALPWAFDCQVDYNSDRVVLISLAAMARPDGIVFANYSDIVKVSGCSAPTATRSVGRLIRRRHLELVKDRGYSCSPKYKLAIADAMLDDIKRFNDDLEPFRKPIDPALLGGFL